MSDLFSQTEHYWYSLISAAPMPESGERVNVGVLVGNGRVTALRYAENLPRLRGIAAADEVNVYAAVLESVAEMVRTRALEVGYVQGILGPQLNLGEPRALLRTPDEQLLSRLVHRFLGAPRQPEPNVNMDALVRKSVARLDEQIARIRPRGVLLDTDVRPHHLYEGRIDNRVPYRVPKLARALRAIGRDVLLDSLLVEDGEKAADVRVVAGRIGQAFYFYDKKLKGLIRTYAGREIRIIGVLQPSAPDASPDTLAMREYIRETWSRDAEVLDGDATNLESGLREAAEWVSA